MNKLKSTNPSDLIKEVMKMQRARSLKKMSQPRIIITTKENREVLKDFFNTMAIHPAAREGWIKEIFILNVQIFTLEEVLVL